MKQSHFFLFFSLTFLALFFQLSYFPYFHLHIFAPLLAYSCMRGSFLRAQLIAIVAALFFEFLSSQSRFGLHLFNYVFLIVLMYPMRKHFFAESGFALCCFTALISSCLSLLLVLKLAVSGHSLTLHSDMLFTDLITMPIVDGLYAFFCYICPLKLYESFLFRTKGSTHEYS